MDIDTTNTAEIITMREMRERIRSAQEPITVYLTPLNEGHELAYTERFQGTPAQIVERCRKIVFSLGELLPNGTWSVSVESTNADGSFCGNQSVRIDLDRVFDSDFNVIADISILGGIDL